LKRDDPRPIQLHQYEAIGMSIHQLFLHALNLVSYFRCCASRVGIESSSTRAPHLYR
jgi:hypothetical protein